MDRYDTFIAELQRAKLAIEYAKMHKLDVVAVYVETRDNLVDGRVLVVGAPPKGARTQWSSRRCEKYPVEWAVFGGSIYGLATRDDALALGCPADVLLPAPDPSPSGVEAGSEGASVAAGGGQ